jgi:hypothetical protein
VKIEGILDLEGVAFAYPLYITRSTISDGIIIQDATIRTFVLYGSAVGSIEGRRVTVNGLLSFKRCRLKTVTLHDARIQGSLVAEGARLRSSEEFGFAADRIAVTGSLFLRNGFRCSSGITVADCTIAGSADLTRAVLHESKGLAVRAPRADVGGSVIFDRARIRGEVQFITAKVGGVLKFDGTRLNNPAGRTLNANGARVGAAILLGAGFVSIPMGN